MSSDKRRDAALDDQPTVPLPPADQAAARAPLRLPSAIQAGQTIGGRWRVDEMLGEGGMGKVYAGFDDKLGRRVALKSIRHRYRFSDEMKARFVQEAQILSRLQHPNICQIYDYLEVPEGDFLVLELIEGKSLKQMALEPFGDDDKMRIAVELAGGLVAAHSAGIVHRDLKPANVMIDADGSVKMLDFGIARSLESAPVSTDRQADSKTTRGLDYGGDLDPEATALADSAATYPVASESSLRTRTGSVVGTPQFMSPEQANSEPVTPASDMYSFGLLLHELFTGRSPYATGLSTLELLAAVSEGRTEPVEGLDPELAALIERLQSKAPGARPSAIDTAERLRWIRDAPIRRTRRRLKLAAVVLLAVLAAVMTFQALRIRQEAERARRAAAEAIREAETSSRVLELLTSLFEASDPWQDSSAGSALTVREVLDRGAERLDTELATQPAVRARLLDTVGTIYGRLGLHEKSRPLLEQALDLRRDHADTTDAELADSLLHLGETSVDQARFDEAAEQIQQSLVSYRAAGDRLGEAKALDRLGRVYAEQGRQDEAEPLYRQSLELREQELGDDHQEVATSLTSLATLIEQQGRFGEAEAMVRRAIDIRQARLGDHHPLVAWSLNILGILLDQQSRAEEALPVLERALAIAEQRLGLDNPAAATILMNTGIVRNRLNQVEEAEACYLEARERFEQALGEDHPRVGEALGNLANLYSRQGRYAEAEPLVRRAQAIFIGALGPDHPNVGLTWGDLGALAFEAERYDESTELFERAAAIFDQALGSDHPETARTLARLAVAEARAGELDAARQRATRALDIAVATFGDAHVELIGYRTALAEIERRDANMEAAAEHLRTARTLAEGAELAADHQRWIGILRQEANLARDRGERRRAEELYDQAEALIIELLGDGHPKLESVRRDRAGG